MSVERRITAFQGSRGRIRPPSIQVKNRMNNTPAVALEVLLTAPLGPPSPRTSTPGQCPGMSLIWCRRMGCVNWIFGSFQCRNIAGNRSLEGLFNSQPMLD